MFGNPSVDSLIFLHFVSKTSYLYGFSVACEGEAKFAVACEGKLTPVMPPPKMLKISYLPTLR